MAEGITFGFESNASSFYLNASMFARIIRDPASPTEEVRKKKCLINLCKPPFLIMCYLASFMMNAVKVNSPSMSARKRMTQYGLL